MERTAGEGVQEERDAVENARIMESVKNETESGDKDLSPDGLVYNVSNFELEVERFLEVESWNAEHGIQVTDEVEEKLVEEMKAAHAVGDERRGKIKESFGQAARSLEGAQEALKDLNARLEQSAKDAEAASSAEASDALPEGAPPHLEIALPLPDAPGTAAGAPSAGHRSNPYAEYKALLSSRSTASARSDGEASDSASVFSEPSGLDVDNAAVRSRIAKLRAESELLRKCAKEGARGDFAAFRKALVSKNS